MSYELILIDDPAPHVRRITLNRPEKRNAISTPMRKELLAALQDADVDDSVRVSIIREQVRVSRLVTTCPTRSWMIRPTTRRAAMGSGLAM